MGSCLSTNLFVQFQKPVVAVDDAQVRGMSLWNGASVDVSLLITNPNSTGKLDATEFTCMICNKSDGSVLSEDTLKQEISIPPSGSADVVVPLKVGIFGIGSSGKSILVRGATEIIVSGEVTFNAPMAETRALKVPYQREIDIVFSSE